ncbi:helix-turn-helix transcriptional regulator [Fodinicola acaciae]|uniref:helix-turn-helix transcriptional regulator n=1 Tax=Fodinicola acaciae TaxID=2681555 RepID=UPI0013D16268|nr:YafY family protein [Fodinicola acaciae]
MRSDRLLAILMLLQSRGRLSAGELAERLEVSRRTIYRDIEALSAAGVPVYAERGRNGGCALVPGYRTDMTGLSTDEARALFVFAGRGDASTPGLEPALRSALRKLMAALPAGQQPDVDHAMRRVVVDSRRWGGRDQEDHPALPVIEDAVWRDRRVRIRYRHGRDGRPATYTLDPYGLVHKANVWYLIAAHRGEPRMFRVSRVLDATVLDETADRPADLDLEDLWQQLRSRFESRGEGLDARLLVRAESRDRILGIARGQMVDEPRCEPADADGWCAVSARFRGILPARGVLLGMGAEVVVVSPPELRKEMLTAAEAVLAAYRDRAERATEGDDNPV